MSIQNCRAVLFVLALFIAAAFAGADPVPARLKQGVGHIFLLILDEDGKTLAAGESLQTVKGYTVTTRTTFNFRDGSLDDETTVFEQRVNLRLITDDHVQRGPAFPHPLEIRIEAVQARVTIHDLESNKTVTNNMKIPFDLANGIITQVLQNIAQDAAETKVSYVLPASKPRLATLVISPAGEDTYTLGSERRTARKLEMKVELGGVAGLIAPIIGKEPRPTTAWMAGGRVPMFIRIRTQFFEGGPLWTIQQTAPAWGPDQP